MKIERLPDSKARYAVLWRGIRRERDREHLISGAEWIAFDRRNGEVLAVLRDFYLTGETTNVKERISWLNARRCPFVNKRYRFPGETNVSSFWIPEVLRPAQFPKVLEAIFEANEWSEKK